MISHDCLILLCPPHPELLSPPLLEPYVPDSRCQTLLIKRAKAGCLLTQPGRPRWGLGWWCLSRTPVKRLCWDLQEIVNYDEDSCLFSLSGRNVRI